MALRDDMEPWLIDALRRSGGAGKILDLAKDIWDHHESDIKATAHGLYNWQYEMRWCGQALQKKGKMKKDYLGRRGIWGLVP